MTLVTPRKPFPYDKVSPEMLKAIFSDDANNNERDMSLSRSFVEKLLYSRVDLPTIGFPEWASKWNPLSLANNYISDAFRFRHTIGGMPPLPEVFRAALDEPKEIKRYKQDCYKNFFIWVLYYKVGGSLIDIFSERFPNVETDTTELEFCHLYALVEDYIIFLLRADEADNYNSRVKEALLYLHSNCRRYINDVDYTGIHRNNSALTTTLITSLLQAKAYDAGHNQKFIDRVSSGVDGLIKKYLNEDDKDDKDVQ